MNTEKSIRFIDSSYHELFRIPDGGSIQVDYPDRHFSAPCRYVDDYHTQVGMNLYHICQFAELLERGGGTCHPEPELERDAAAWSVGSENYLTVKRSSDGWQYLLYDSNFHKINAGEIDGAKCSILEARDRALERCQLVARNRELVDDYREAYLGVAENPVPENALKTAEMQTEDDYDMIDGVINNGAKAQEEAGPEPGGRYEMTLEMKAGNIYSIQANSERGYLLSDGTMLFEMDKDENGFYTSGMELDRKSKERYEPVHDENGVIKGFRKMSLYIADFSGEEQKLIYQYAMNTRENLLEDLKQIQSIVKDPKLCRIISNTCKKLEKISDEECISLMADIRAAYKERNRESIRQRQKASQKETPVKKRKRGMER